MREEEEPAPQWGSGTIPGTPGTVCGHDLPWPLGEDVQLHQLHQSGPSWCQSQTRVTFQGNVPAPQLRAQQGGQGPRVDPFFILSLPLLQTSFMI